MARSKNSEAEQLAALRNHRTDAKERDMDSSPSLASAMLRHWSMSSGFTKSNSKSRRGAAAVPTRSRGKP